MLELNCSQTNTTREQTIQSNCLNESSTTLACGYEKIWREILNLYKDSDVVTVEQITEDALHSVEISYFSVTQISPEFNFEGSKNSKNAVSANF